MLNEDSGSSNKLTVKYRKRSEGVEDEFLNRPRWEIQEEDKQNSRASLSVAPNLVFTASTGLVIDWFLLGI